ncbi:PIG-L deacetylase family protein [Methylobacterium oryzihabitans]|uniref:PIG-L deacetylase family protein n=1 Tax=Methylobacterium oryzihabitans TaxID=2499852 RepID=UPI001FEA619F|nr:PIG-L family deacetylase [Methylobacterium oryzihabitans]
MTPDPDERRLPPPDRPGAPASPAERFLAALADPACGPVDAERAALVVAHPDDESIGCGAQLPRLRGLTVVHVTGAGPRLEELDAAMALAGVPAARRLALGYADGGVAERIPDLAHRLAGLFAERGIAVALTHAWEGGHSDHDAVALAVAGARRRLGPDRLGVVEMPYYHAGPDGFEAGGFLPAVPPRRAIALHLDPDDCALKAALFAAHASQAETLNRMPIALERFREAPEPDVSALPNGGRVLYDGPGFLAQARAAGRALGIGG